ncbi:MAG: GAF domain-containing sensor histidine kinase [Chloroflexi bacterium]|nr:GAF domain-containing sensor histidine kinase [Chloroflexota bacterium]
MTLKQEYSPDALLQYVHELEAVNELAEALTLGQGVDGVIETALRRVAALMQVDAGSIYLFEENGSALRLKASQGRIPSDLAAAIARVDPKSYPLSELLASGHAIAIDDARLPSGLCKELVDILTREGYLSWACAPLKMEGEIIGVYHLGKRGLRSFSPHDLALLEVIGNVLGSSLSNAQLLLDLRHKENELRRALHRTVELQEEERKRLARELHDEIGQALTSILINLKTIQESCDQQAVNDRLNDLRFLTARTIEELRRLAMDLRPAALDNLGIVPALRWYVQQSAERTGLDIRFLGPEKFERLSPEAELVLYRVAQEGLTNAIRHGRARQVVVALERDQDVVRLSITDNGAGFNPDSLERGLGLIGIRERVELLYGNFDIITAPGAGTQLQIEVPVKRQAL